jgi:hypothetical protein
MASLVLFLLLLLSKPIIISEVKADNNEKSLINKITSNLIEKSKLITTSPTSTPKTFHSLGNQANVILYGGIVLKNNNKAYIFCGTLFDEDPNNYFPVHDVSVYDIKLQSWSYFTNSLPTARFGHTATLTKNGNVVLIGGKGRPVSNVYVPIQYVGIEMVNLTSMATTKMMGGLDGYYRMEHSATSIILSDGTDRIFIAYGKTPDNTVTGYANRVHVFNPTTHTMSRGMLMDCVSGYIFGRLTTLTPLTSSVFGAGLCSETSKRHIEIFNGLTNSFSAVLTSSLSDKASRTTHFSITALPGNFVLICGGYSPNLDPPSPIDTYVTNECELYDPVLLRMRPTASMTIPRGGHFAIAFSSHEVLVTGGFTGKDFGLIQSSEIFDLKTEKWTLISKILPPVFTGGNSIVQNGLLAPRNDLGGAVGIMNSGVLFVSGTIGYAEPIVEMYS